MTEQLFSVPDITCEHCAATIREAVTGVPGVHTVRVDVAGKQVRVIGHADAQALHAAIADAGYRAA